MKSSHAFERSAVRGVQAPLRAIDDGRSNGSRSSSCNRNQGCKISNSHISNYHRRGNPPEVPAKRRQRSLQRCARTTKTPEPDAFKAARQAYNSYVSAPAAISKATSSKEAVLRPNGAEQAQRVTDHHASRGVPCVSHLISNSLRLRLRIRRMMLDGCGMCTLFSLRNICMNKNMFELLGGKAYSRDGYRPFHRPGAQKRRPTNAPPSQTINLSRNQLVTSPLTHQAMLAIQYARCMCGGAPLPSSTRHPHATQNVHRSCVSQS